jgi:hypothetical protein
VLLGADFHFCGATLWKYKLPPLDDDGNIMATIGWLIGRMVPDAAPCEASAGTKGRRMRMSEASRCRYCSSPEISVIPFFPVPLHFSLRLGSWLLGSDRVCKLDNETTEGYQMESR